jgi:hypothetical protein
MMADYVEVSAVKRALNLARLKAEDKIEAASRGVRTEDPVIGADRLVDKAEDSESFQGVVEEDGVRATVTVTVEALAKSEDEPAADKRTVAQKLTGK